MEILRTAAQKIGITGPIHATGRAHLYRSHWQPGQWRHDWIRDLVGQLRDISKKKWLPLVIRDQAMYFAFKLRPIAGATASNAFEDDILKLVFQAVTFASIAINATASPATNIATALHTADPGEAGTQSTSEAAYGSYARTNVARTTGGFTVSSGAVTPAANITFPTSSGSGSTITHFSYGHSVANYMICSGSISPTIPVGAAGVTPILTTATSVTCD